MRNKFIPKINFCFRHKRPYFSDTGAILNVSIFLEIQEIRQLFGMLSVYLN